MWLNIDAGELPDEPEELYALAHGVNVACGGHAGDARSMAEAAARCRRHGTRLGAHPSYRDREGFGRRALFIAPSAVAAEVEEQCRRLAEIAAGAGLTVAHVKPHGALYHAAARDDAVAEAVVAGAIAALGGPLVVGSPGSALARAARRAGLAFAREGFADRGVRGDGSLIPREAPGALLDEPAARAQALALARGESIDTLCVHGDTPGALAIARGVRAVLDGFGGEP